MSADCRSPVIRDASVTAKDETKSERSTMVSAIRATTINTDVGVRYRK